MAKKSSFFLVCERTLEKLLESRCTQLPSHNADIPVERAVAVDPE